MSTYDQFPYTNHVHPETNPDHLRSVAFVYGLRPPDLDGARILEIGSGRGGNLLQYAVRFPNSTFVGIDLSGEQTHEALEAKTALKLKNIDFVQLNFRDLGSEFGEFDYIIAHGVYSWVSPTLQDRLLGLYEEHLSDNGVGYLSFNVLPGWQDKLMMREIMLRAAIRSRSPQEQVAFAKEALIDFLDTRPSGRLQETARDILQGDNRYIFHEYLDEYNIPEEFGKFVKKLKKRKLRYLEDATATTRFNPVTLAPLLLGGSPKNLIDLEKLKDKKDMTLFRRSLFVKSSKRPTLNAQPERIEDLWLRSELTPETSGDQAKPLIAGCHRGRVQVRDQFLRKALQLMADHYPEPYLGRELLDRLEVSDSERFLTAEKLTALFLFGLIEVSSHPVLYSKRVSPKPLSSELIRYMAKQTENLVNLRLENLRLDKLPRELLQHLDGTHDLGELTDIMKQHLEVEEESSACDSEWTERMLKRFADQALLVK